MFNDTFKAVVIYTWIKFIWKYLKQSGVDPTPEGSLTLLSNLLWGVVNRGLYILDNLTKLNITKYQAQFSEFLYYTNFEEIQKQLLKTYKNFLIRKLCT